jgi:hypothetical protein
MNGLLLFFATAVAYLAAFLLVRWFCAEVTSPPFLKLWDKLLRRETGPFERKAGT